MAARQLASGDRYKQLRGVPEPARRSDSTGVDSISKNKSLLTRIAGPQALLQKESKDHPSQEADKRCAKLRDEASSRIQKLAAQMPPRQLLPSPAAPFAFLHNRKCGGSSLRSALWGAASALNLTAIVPCFPPLHDCYRYNVGGIDQSVLDASSVFAGHLSWDAIEDLGAERNTSCFTMLRDPVDMFASYFYHRHPLSFRDKRALSDLTSQDLRRALDLNDTDAPWEWWELGGPANSATRLLSGADISGHVIGHDAVQYVARRKGIPLDLELAKRRLSRCVVGLLSDMPATDKALAHWFPWVPNLAGAALNVNVQRPRKESLQPDVRDLILEYMSLDVKLYEYGLRQFGKQKELIGMLDRQTRPEDDCA
ncbi:hypothetical protein KFL_001260240 [Klebsormidium nitens]|uniref:Sulfotransferase n=1 Tax=Klebsormidium nitens TaxID=105231 RepID=A0A1Y1HW30_KLENI|nr:hypothetical protein KFL_001260240 [Klebsormidium nitens]|eukprot:GAQ82854.1 hypothetical protein KFL_001260240 [Klebsormidium nitens]